MEIKLPWDLNEIPSKLETITSTISNLSSYVTELKNIQWELPTEFLDLPHLASSVQEKLKTLDSLPGPLKMVTNTLNRFSTLLENTSGTTTTSVPSTDKATATPAEGEKDADTNLKNELIKKRRQSSKIINCDVLTKKGPISLKVYKEDGTAEVIEKFNTNDLLLAKWREETDCFMPKGIKQSPLENVLLKSVEKYIRFSLKGLYLFLHHSSANSWQWDLHSSGIGNTLHWQWALILPVGTLSWQWECLVHFIPNSHSSYVQLHEPLVL
nr:hypothetical protein [Tanacetum cinerariifolium]